MSLSVQERAVTWFECLVRWIDQRSPRLHGNIWRKITYHFEGWFVARGWTTNSRKDQRKRIRSTEREEEDRVEKRGRHERWTKTNGATSKRKQKHLTTPTVSADLTSNHFRRKAFLPFFHRPTAKFTFWRCVFLFNSQLVVSSHRLVIKSIDFDLLGQSFRLNGADRKMKCCTWNAIFAKFQFNPKFATSRRYNSCWRCDRQLFVNKGIHGEREGGKESRERERVEEMTREEELCHWCGGALSVVFSSKRCDTLTCVCVSDSHWSHAQHQIKVIANQSTWLTC